MLIVELIAGSIGIALLLAFLGILMVWINALPLNIIIVFVVILLLTDFVQSLRSTRRQRNARMNNPT